jgi:triacylglycerol lipase
MEWMNTRKSVGRGERSGGTQPPLEIDGPKRTRGTKKARAPDPDLGTRRRTTAFIARPESFVAPEDATPRDGATTRNTATALADVLTTGATSVVRAIQGLIEGSGTGLSREVFANVLDAFSAGSDHAVVDALKGDHPAVAETLALFGARAGTLTDLDRQKLTDEAFTHYAVNTDGPLQDQPSSGSQALVGANDYAQRVGYRYVRADASSIVVDRGPDQVSLAKIGNPPPSLRDLGRKINLDRFGNDRVLPPNGADFEHGQEYSAKNAYWGATLAQLAYADPAVVQAQARAWSLTDVRIIGDPASDTHAFAAVRGDTVVVAFRGTSSLSNFQTDAGFLKTAALGGNVHRGFWAASQSVQDQVAAALKDLAPGRKVIFTGHSLGAALAQLAALQFADGGGQVDGVYTYGTPRVGDAAFGAHYDRVLGDKTFAHINNKDMVARVPPTMLGYVDLGFKQYVFDADGEMTIVPIQKAAPRVASFALEAAPAAPDLDAMLADAVAAIRAGEGRAQAAIAPEAMMAERAIFGLSPPQAIGDHMIKNYMRLIGDRVRAALLDGADAH